MIRFEPKTLEEEFISVINKLDFFEGKINEITLDEIKDRSCYDDYDIEITENSSVVLFTGMSIKPSVTISYLKEICKFGENSRIDSNQRYALNDVEACFEVNTIDYNTHMLFENLLNSTNSIVSKSENGTSLWKKKYQLIIKHIRFVYIMEFAYSILRC